MKTCIILSWSNTGTQFCGVFRKKNNIVDSHLFQSVISKNLLQVQSYVSAVYSYPFLQVHFSVSEL